MPSGIYKRKKNIKYGMTGKHHSKETIKQIVKMQKGIKRGKNTKQHNINISNRKFYWGKKISKALKGRKIEWKNKISKTLTGRKLLKQHLENILKANYIYPNKKEIQLYKLLPKNFKMNDERKVIINGRVPDFVDKKARKVIELFGDYWHKNDSVRKKIFHYKKQGWKCIVIWERELKKENKLKKKIKEFIDAKIGNL